MHMGTTAVAHSMAKVTPIPWMFLFMNLWGTFSQALKSSELGSTERGKSEHLFTTRALLLSSRNFDLRII